MDAANFVLLVGCEYDSSSQGGDAMIHIQVPFGCSFQRLCMSQHGTAKGQPVLNGRASARFVNPRNALRVVAHVASEFVMVSR